MGKILTVALALSLVAAVAVLPASRPAGAQAPGFEFDGCTLLTVEEVAAYAGTEVLEARRLRIRDGQIASCEYVLGDGAYGSGAGMHVVIDPVPPEGIAEASTFAGSEHFRLDPVDVGDEGYVAVQEFVYGGELTAEDVVQLFARVGDVGLTIGGKVDAALGPLAKLEPGSALAEELIELGQKVAERLPAALASRGGGAGGPAGGEDGGAEASEAESCDGFAAEFRGPRVYVQGYEVTIEVVGDAYGAAHERSTDWGAGTALPSSDDLSGHVLTSTVTYPEAQGVYDGAHTVTVEREGERCTASLPFVVEISDACTEVTGLLDRRGYRLVLGVTDESSWGNTQVFGPDPYRMWRERETFTGTDRVAAILAPAPDPDFELDRISFDGTAVPENRHPGSAQASGWAVASYVFPDLSARTGGQVVTQEAVVAARLRIPPGAVRRLAGSGGAGGGPSLSSAPACHYTVEATIQIRHQPWLWQCFEQLGPCRLARRTDVGARWGEVQAAASYLKDLDDLTSVIPPIFATPADVVTWIGDVEGAPRHARLRGGPQRRAPVLHRPYARVATGVPAVLSARRLATVVAAVLALAACSGGAQPEVSLEDIDPAADAFCEGLASTVDAGVLEAAEGIEPGGTDYAAGFEAYVERVRDLAGAAPEELHGDFDLVVDYLREVEELLAAHGFDTERLYASPPVEDLERIEAMDAGAAVDAIRSYADRHCSA